ncbi:hypothetical protein P154DRAFT_528599 [Amniculicola lignicola CBS 123094]|uniref:WSC domain-containing protein n=1 Tax=Amniculicola lignicola CBS 123094 TaxID=1392246 RepID=A0A6A5X4U8_9PLEO|nr:hypothetical protein P154DRAFT_528599 [Amniculicola lignicola CBS 123094]
MISSTFVSAVAAVVLASTALVQADTPSSVVVSIASPTVTVLPGTPTQIGCFSSFEPLEDHGYSEFQSDGNCQRICVMLDKAVFAMVDGTDCWCGDKIPVKTSQVGNSSCSTSCNGFPGVNCGGDRMWWVALSGTTRNKVQYFEPGSSSASSVSKTTPASQASESVSTAVVTQTSTGAPKSKSSGSNKTAIAVGVVVGVVALAGIIIGVMLYLRHQRRRQVEEEYRRQAAANSFVAGGKLHTSNSSMTDSRLDPEFMMRRASNGSIADNEDYSRRILQVTNPDGR